MLTRLLAVTAGLLFSPCARAQFDAQNMNVTMMPDRAGKTVMVKYKLDGESKPSVMFVDLATGKTLDWGGLDDFGMAMKLLRYGIVDQKEEQSKLRFERTNLVADGVPSSYFRTYYKDTIIGFVETPFSDGAPGVSAHLKSRTVLFYVNRAQERLFYNATYRTGDKLKGASKPLMKSSTKESIWYDAVQFSPDGSRGFVTQGCLMFDLKKNKLLWKADPPTYSKAAFSPDGDSIQVAAGPTGVTIRDARKGKVLTTLPAPPASLAGAGYTLSYFEATASMRHYIARYGAGTLKKGVRLYVVGTDGSAKEIVP